MDLRAAPAFIKAFNLPKHEVPMVRILVPRFRPQIGHARPVDVALPRARGQGRAVLWDKLIVSRGPEK